MRLWRLAPRRHATRLDGGGNRDTGARWNSGRGRGVVYASFSVATCVLETFVHFGPRLRAKLPGNLVLVGIEVPDDAAVLEIAADGIPENVDLPEADGRTWYQRTAMPGWSRAITSSSSRRRRWCRGSGTPCSIHSTRAWRR